MKWETLEIQEAQARIVKPDSSPSKFGRISVYSLIRFTKTWGVEAPLTREAYSAIKDFDEVKEAVLTYGEFDLVFRIEVKSMEDLDQFIFDTLRKIKGIDEVTSLITVRAHLGW